LREATGAGAHGARQRKNQRGSASFRTLWSLVGRAETRSTRTRRRQPGRSRAQLLEPCCYYGRTRSAGICETSANDPPAPRPNESSRSALSSSFDGKLGGGRIPTRAGFSPSSHGGSYLSRFADYRKQQRGLAQTVFAGRTVASLARGQRATMRRQSEAISWRVAATNCWHEQGPAYGRVRRKSTYQGTRQVQLKGSI